MRELTPAEKELYGVKPCGTGYRLHEGKLHRACDECGQFFPHIELTSYFGRMPTKKQRLCTGCLAAKGESK